MPNNRTQVEEKITSSASGWQGIALITGTYTYFLIFAQFGFLKRLDEVGLSNSHLKAVMAAMAVGGILASFAAAWVRVEANPVRRLQAGLLGCALAAALTVLPLGLAGALVLAALIGISLGVLTVTMVTHLPLWMGSRQPLVKIALGTGAAYFISNIPALFTAAPNTIAITVALLLALCIPVAALRHPVAEATASPQPASRVNPFLLVLLWFTALVWFDSAAFFIIQHAPQLHSGAWVGAANLWRTGAIHLVAALFAAWLLARRGFAVTLTSAFVLLAGACLLLLDPMHVGPAAWLYPAGVSLYSVALVAYPAYLLVADGKQRARQAGAIYAVGGWVGSAMGIGMAQHLHRVPPAFIATVAVIFVVPAVWFAGRRYWREMAAIAAVCLISLGVEQGLNAMHPPVPATAQTAVERGRHVYISEGCIHCHSQYVRPGTHDVLLWGPASNVHQVQQEKPPLIGNRRQGPDLSNVGSRRSPLWLKIHLIDPRAVSPRSIMPSYAYLFRNRRGDDLVAYLSSLKSPESKPHLQHELSTWQPSAQARQAAGPLDGEALAREYCATCHSADGAAMQRWGEDFRHKPQSLVTGQWKQFPAHASSGEQRLYLSRIIKFGMPGTDMPGHEYLPDAQIAAMARWIVRARAGNAGEKAVQ
ncbi:MAG: cbb3-type cytochrome c oxidase subunit II [Acidobacteriaceae bacterium]